MTKILGLSGKKQAGKNCSANYLFGSIAVDVGFLVGRDITAKGELVGAMVVPDADGNEQQIGGIIDPMSRDPRMQDVYAQFLWQFVKFYSFADPLKEFCIDVLGLSEEQCYGTNEQKDTESHLQWEDMPGVLTPQQISELADNMRTPLGEPSEQLAYPLCLDPAGPNESGEWDSTMRLFGIRAQEAGPMTGRNVMQYFGTDICRKMYNNVWVDATIRQIQAEQVGLALIPDVRFPNEVIGIQEAGGKVIRFLRAPFAGEDEHESETALDDFDLDKFDAVIDNREMTIPEQNKAVVEAMQEWDWSTFEV